MKLGIGIALVLAGFVVLVLWMAARHESRAEAAFPPEGQFVEVQGHRVHVVVLGEENAGRDLVLIHGSSGNTRDMTFDIAPELAKRYRVAVFDRPGLGYTDRINTTGATINQQAALLQEAAAQLGFERPLVLGHSYGGAVALAWAVDARDQLAGLVLVSSPTQPWTSDLSLYYKTLSNPVLGPMVIPVLTAFVPDSLVEREVSSIFAPQDAPEGYPHAVAAALTLRRDSLRANALQRANLLDEITNLQPRYGQIDVPVEIVHGRADRIVGAEIHVPPFLKQVPKANATLLPGIGHMPHHVAMDHVIAAIDRAAARANLLSNTATRASE
ncbi:alpha/beta fold hydrolase [Rhodalgimonas zhirmunskyi]|uniref:Alpha/beta hydrolase n=1 Tax=Rhodalgimonas zhirmunskyi TaxID=2964767 RepID=A0AAJ1U7Q8_9RHOB|nr:alpha/beta hydrolase [Rhodoalgimonas zhirmunskyi]MDQ2092853.1 alpha/beta hydrolase [Rhodoalgimonas zhirmunskyi]